MNMDQSTDNEVPAEGLISKRPVRWDRNDLDRQEQFIAQLNNRFKVTFETIAMNCLVAIIIIFALITDQLALIVLAMLVAPTLTPIFGFSFGISLNSFSLIKKAFLSFAAAGGIIFASGLFAGFIANQLDRHLTGSWLIFSQLSWGTVILIVAGNLFALTIFIRNPLQSMNVTNVALAYGFYLPLASAGFLLSQGDLPHFQLALQTFLAQYLLAILSGSLILLFFAVRPKGSKVFVPIGIILGTLMLVMAIQTLVNDDRNSTPEVGTVAIIASVTPSMEAISTQTRTPLPTLIILENIPTEEAIIPQITLPATLTPTITLTPLATPVWAQIQALESNGANVRSEPGYKGKIITTILNGTLVQVLAEVEVVDGSTWVHIRLQDQTEGWVVRSLLVSSTPAPDW